MNEPKVFISHSVKDADWVRSFAQALKQRGVSVWFDGLDVASGDSLPDALENGLRNSDVLVAVVDSESFSRPNVLFELGAAIGMGKRVVSIVPKGIEPTALPFDVRLRRYLVRETPEQTAEELSSCLQAA